ncbi:dienelactone hydrolase family protein [Methylocystis sp. JR02]|uniref:dienelactone hydrolase family protein n=1 Tax=Methylocystis sp. JR02 TaxID=3046284 RepID=UPI0024BA6C3B|nr:dienelactone hydrolase family protein [Methylocystis sp. JR02]MDJ0448870.1 dienelactone hydrolase family protein [Methylocystis sp. JR02]
MKDKHVPGFAAAAGSVSAHAIHTDSAGLETGLTTLPGGAPAYFAMPQGGESLPVVLVAEEIFGLHEHMRDVARRLAKLGFFAIAPDYLARYGDPMAAPDIDALRAIAAKVPDAEAMAIFDEALAFTEGKGADAARAAVIGFCWGGRIAWLYAAHNRALSACVPWYGRLDGLHTAVQPRWPIDIAGEIEVSTLGLYGGDDPSIPRDVIAQMQDRLTATGAPAEIIVYDDAPHGFFADYRPSYRETDAHDAWARMRAFLRAQGVG